MKTFVHKKEFPLESGRILRELKIGFTTIGELNAKRDNVIWICHALTANSDPAEWWPGLVGPGKLYDPGKYHIVCANMLGSCYGSTNARSLNPETGLAYGTDFPTITIRDMVKAHLLLCEHLDISSIRLATGGSMGGQQVLEWAIMAPGMLENICVIGTNARHSSWGIAFNEAQRMALEADPTLYKGTKDAGKAGLEAARAIAMLSYRNYEAFSRTQVDDIDTFEGFRASSYLRYQGLKLSSRFSATAYYTLTQAMDLHNVGRNRGGCEEALSKITANTLVVGVETDILFPLSEQQFLHKHIYGSQLRVIGSPYGHDGFLIEFEQLAEIISDWMIKM